jgi:hypothetical protein
MDRCGLWRELESMSAAERQAVLDRYGRRLSKAAVERSLRKLYLLALRRLPTREIADALRRQDSPCLAVYSEDRAAPEISWEPGERWPQGRVAVPLGCAAVRPGGQPASGARLVEMTRAEEAALDTIKFFGHEPNSREAGMPATSQRSRWWALLPEYARFHQEFATEAERGEYRWLEIRPEVVISPLLKSLVQPGFEMIPRVLGFEGLAPMHVKWIRCRYHFRSDTFDSVWRAIVRSTWNESFMVDLLRRVRRAYARLAEVSARFPVTSAELTGIDTQSMVALFEAWWPRWVEFFALCWFIQARGDDVLYPFIVETVDHNLARIGDPATGSRWPEGTDLVAPTTPVMSAEYMTDLARVRQELLDAGLDDPRRAGAAIAQGEHPELRARIEQHLEDWHWMRDRDLLFEPWDTIARVVETALETESHAIPPYEANLRRSVLALALHSDLAHASGRALGLHYAVRMLRDLNVERENHHMLWLKNSYPLRCLLVEIERRLVAAGGLEPGEVFFLQAPEVIQAVRDLPAALPQALALKVKNRRRGYLLEAQLAAADDGAAEQEDDYY